MLEREIKMSETATISEKLRQQLIDVLESSYHQLKEINHPDFGKPTKLLDRITKAIAGLKGKPTPRGKEGGNIS